MFSIFHKISVTLVIISYVHGKGGINETDLTTRCTKLRTNTYEYTSIFPITKEHRDGKDIFLTFYVKSASKASIKLFSASASIQDTYEIILSYSRGTPSEIRLNSWVMTQHFETNISSSDEWRPFWIRISSGRLIQVGKEVGSSTFMSWKDKRPMPINHYGFSSYGNNTVDWAIHCPKKSNGSLTQCTKLTTTKTEYDVMFPITRRVQDGNNIFLPFYVKAERDAHIIFSPTSEPTKSDERAYEIVLGAGGNAYSIIRTSRMGILAVSDTERNILSPNEWRPFWIRIASNGLIEVGKEMGSPAFMTWIDNGPKIDNYAVASYYNGHTVYWAIECPKRNHRKEYTVSMFV